MTIQISFRAAFSPLTMVFATKNCFPTRILLHYTTKKLKIYININLQVTLYVIFAFAALIAMKFGSEIFRFLKTMDARS